MLIQACLNGWVSLVLYEVFLMKLSFLGQPYEASIPSVEATEMNETATFLGQFYARRQYNVHQLRPLASELTYRGVRYTA